MKKVILTLGLMSVCMLFTAMSCDHDNNLATCENILQDLQFEKQSIEAMAAASVCNDDFKCRYIAFGSKPCGGPWKFLVYSTSIDTLAIMNTVVSYNEREAAYNSDCNQVSDCSAPQPPISFECENNRCIPMF